MAYDANGYTGKYTVCAATCTSATVTGLTSGRAHTIVAYASNATGWGAPAQSNSVTVG